MNLYVVLDSSKPPFWGLYYVAGFVLVAENRDDQIQTVLCLIPAGKINVKKESVISVTTEI